MVQLNYKSQRLASIATYVPLEQHIVITFAAQIYSSPALYRASF